MSENAQPVQNVLAHLGTLLPDLESVYKDIHAHPELSMKENRTAGIAADRLRAAGYEVTTGVGKTGVVGVLRNGDGPTIMLRADMDALPVREATGLSYASNVISTDHALWIYELGLPGARSIADTEGATYPFWSADGKFLAFFADGKLKKLEVSGGPDWALFQQLRAGSIDHYQLEKRYFRRDGSLVWGSLSISLLKSSPSPLVLAMVEDITDKKKAEEARYRHAAVVESSDDAIASGTLDGIIVSWNTGAQKIYGYTEAEAVGKPISMLVPPELPDEENKILETLKSGDRVEHFETVRVTKTGKRINVSLTISPIKDSTGRTVGISGIARDISERKLAEEALRASEERLRLAQQAARIETFDRNIRTGVNTWTPELEAMYGLPPGGFGGTQTAFENLVHPDDRAGVIKLVDAAMKSGQPTKGEWRVVWADGSVHWIAGRWQVFMDASGEPSKMIGVNGDVTERKRAEEARLEANRALEEQAALLQSKEELLKSSLNMYLPQ